MSGRRTRSRGRVSGMARARPSTPSGREWKTPAAMARGAALARRRGRIFRKGKREKRPVRFLAGHVPRVGRPWRRRISVAFASKQARGAPREHLFMACSTMAAGHAASQAILPVARRFRVKGPCARSVGGARRGDVSPEAATRGRPLPGPRREAPQQAAQTQGADAQKDGETCNKGPLPVCITQDATYSSLKRVSGTPQRHKNRKDWSERPVGIPDAEKGRAKAHPFRRAGRNAA